MAEMNDHLEDLLVEYIFRSGTFTQPTTLAFALLTTAADDDDTAVFSTQTGVEVTNAGAYARVNRAAGGANWTATAAGDGQTDNAAAITYTTATANWSSGANIVGVAICDNATYDTGNVYFYSNVDVAKPVNQDDTAEFAAGAVTVTFA